MDTKKVRNTLSIVEEGAQKHEVYVPGVGTVTLVVIDNRLWEKLKEAVYND